MKPKFIFFILIILSSCHKKENYNLKSIADANFEMVSPAPPPPPPSDNNTETQTKLIKTGKLKIISTDIETIKKKLNEILTNCKGTITYESLTKDETESYYSLLYSVPANNFDKFTQLIDSLDLNIAEKTYKVSDVTLKYIDETSRLNNKKKLEKTYTDLLAKASSIKNIIDIQEKIEEIRADIESREEQLKTLNNKIAFSEFDITLETPKKEKHLISEKNESIFSRFTDAIISGFSTIIDSFIFLISIWPIYILIFILFLIFKYFRKKHKK
jgi:hypothetical protein